MTEHLYVHPQGHVMDRETVELYLYCGHCWLPRPRLSDWWWIFLCFCKLSPNYIYLTCRNFVCEHSVIAKATVKRCAFAFNVFDLQILRWHYFSANMSQNVITPRAWIPPDCDRLAEKLALLHLRLFPQPFSNHAMVCSGGVGEGTSECRLKNVPTWKWLHGPISPYKKC